MLFRSRNMQITKGFRPILTAIYFNMWENLNEDNKVSLFVRFIDIETGNYESRIVNKNK